MRDHHEHTEIDAGHNLRAVVFSADGKHLVSGCSDGVKVWRVHDGEQMASMPVSIVFCLAVSQDGRWVAAGTVVGDVFVWNATTHEQVFKLGEDPSSVIHSIDFSPDSKRLISASEHKTTLWDFETAKQIQTFIHDDWVIAAKYSLQGDKVATATREVVRVWDSDNGTLLVRIPAKVVPWHNNGLLWFHDHLFVASGGKIRELDVSTGSTVMTWEVPNTRINCCLALSKHGEFIAYSTEDTVTFWDTLTRTQIARIQHPLDIRSIAISSGNRLAIGGNDGTIILQNWDRVIEPDFRIDPAALEAWKHDHLDSAETSLTTVITTSQNPDHRAFACRAVIRARLRNWSMALVDAKLALDIQPSVMGYIAKSMAHAVNGEKYEACRACDLALVCRRSCCIFNIDLSDVTFLLLIKAIIVFMAGEHTDAISRINDLIITVQRNSIFYVVQARMHFLVGNLYMESGDYEHAIQSFECAQAQLRPYPKQPLLAVSLILGWRFDDLDILIRQGFCEALYSVGRAREAGSALLELVQCFEVYKSDAIIEWISDFTRRCLSVPDTTSNTAPGTDTAILCGGHAPLLVEWAKATLASRFWRDALGAGTAFIVPKWAICRVLYERLEANNCTTDAIECLLEMANELAQTTDCDQARWIVDKGWCIRALEDFGDDAMNARHYDKAIVGYSAALSLKHKDLEALFAKRSKARANMGLWQDALNDANEVITLDPSLPLGHERKYAALRGAGHYSDAEAAFETMLAKMAESANPEIRERARRYVKPTETESAIREAVQRVICVSPLILINTHSGRLLDRAGQASSFESQLIFHELVLSTTTQIDQPRILDEVARYYRYATFSHKWKANEPLYEKVLDVVVYDLEDSPTHEKLQNFCRIAREAGLHWAWTDTCCINKADPSILQEALVSMFQWYQSSALTIVLLCDVPWRRLGDSIWNTRAWTFQEYHASKVVRFYNKDWTPYRSLDVPNHKECPEIITEMEEATGISAQALISLRPGLEDIREKLRLASVRQSTRVEDAAYSLFGIFSLSLPVIYGEGDQALGRLLAQLLTNSGDTSILAWTGESGGFNSCLPAVIAVFGQPPVSHIPPAIAHSEIDTTTAGLHTAFVDLTSIWRFYDLLNDLAVPQFSGKRMKLPCITFKLGPLSSKLHGLERAFRAKTAALGIVEVKTEEDLSGFDSLTLVHPWIDFLLDRQPAGSVLEPMIEETTDDRSSIMDKLPSHIPSPVSRTLSTRFLPRLGLFGGRRSRDANESSPHPTPDAVLLRTSSYVESLQPPSTLAESNKQLRAFKMLARLRQPFGALLLTPDSGGVAAYRRVASDCLIRVQVQEITPAILERLIGSVRVLDVL